MSTMYIDINRSCEPKELSLNEFQRSMHTYKKAHEECHALGIAGELAEVSEELAAFRAAGHVADIVKKAVSHGVAGDRTKLLKELGDVLWYIAAVASDNGITLEEIARENIAKLRERYPAGFEKGGGVRHVSSSHGEDQPNPTPSVNLRTEIPAVLCEHANECPNVCPCPPYCYCRRVGSAPSCKFGVRQVTYGVSFACGCRKSVAPDGTTTTIRCVDTQCRRLR